MTTEQQEYDMVPENRAPAKNIKQRRLNIIFTVVFIVLSIAIGYLLYTLFSERKEAKESTYLRGT